MGASEGERHGSGHPGEQRCHFPRGTGRGDDPSGSPVSVRPHRSDGGTFCSRVTSQCPVHPLWTIGSFCLFFFVSKHDHTRFLRQGFVGFRVPLDAVGRCAQTCRLSGVTGNRSPFDTNFSLASTQEFLSPPSRNPDRPIHLPPATSDPGRQNVRRALPRVATRVEEIPVYTGNKEKCRIPESTVAF